MPCGSASCSAKSVRMHWREQGPLSTKSPLKISRFLHEGFSVVSCSEQRSMSS